MYLIAILITILVYLIESRWLASQVHHLLWALKIWCIYVSGADSFLGQVPCEWVVTGLVYSWFDLSFFLQCFYNCNGAGFRHFETVWICFLLSCLDGCLLLFLTPNQASVEVLAEYHVPFPSWKIQKCVTSHQEAMIILSIQRWICCKYS